MASVTLRVIMSVALLLLASVANADHTEFNYQIDNFRLTGNHVAGYVEETFNAEISGACSWDNYPEGGDPELDSFGTTNQTGGICHLTDPGTHGTVPNFPGLTFDRSDIFAPAYPFAILEGSGDGSVEAIISDIPGLPAGFLAMYMYFFNDTTGTTEAVAISMFNGNVEGVSYIESLLGGGYQPGLNISVMRASITPDGVISVVDTEVHQIDPADVDGDIHYLMEFSDSDNSVAVSYSIDGGATAYVPFDMVNMTLPLASGEGARFAFLGDPMTFESIAVPASSTGTRLLMVVLILAIAYPFVQNRTHTTNA